MNKFVMLNEAKKSGLYDDDGWKVDTDKMMAFIRDIEGFINLRNSNVHEENKLRDHFACAAMQVLLVDATSMNNAASNAYDMADLMLAERGKNEN